MANLTLSVEDDVLKKARFRALERGTSVNQLVRQYLTKLAGDERAERGRREALIAEIDALARKVRGGTGGRKWKREELYERVARRTRT
jgi:hypothetical protein